MGGLTLSQQPALQQSATLAGGQRRLMNPSKERLTGNRSLGHLTNAAEREKTGEKIFSHNINIITA